MLPQIKVSNNPSYRRKRPRPINPSDTAASTGLAVNPNGTYVANPYPTTGQAGMQGGYGAMLPQVNVGTAPTWNPNFTPLEMSGGLLHAPSQPFNTTSLMHSPRYATPTASVPQQPTYLGQGTYLGGQAGVGVSPPSSSTGGFIPTPRMTGMNMSTITILENIARDKNYINNLSPELKATVEGMLGMLPETTGPGGRPLTAAEGGDTDYSRTAAAQYNAEHNVPYEQQLRWDPKSRKYIPLGKFFRQQKKRNQNERWARGQKTKQQQLQNRQQQANDGYVLANSFVNFSTGTG